MDKLPSKQRERLARKIREGKDKLCPGRGGCGKFAALLGISPNLLSQWMNGNRQPTPQQLAHLAKLFKSRYKPCVHSRKSSMKRLQRRSTLSST